MFKDRGYIIVDATYEPVNRLTQKGRNSVILRDMDLLKKDIIQLINDVDTPLILVKANVCRLLEGPLTDAGFNVLNRGLVIPFPSTGHQRKFHEIMEDVLGQLNI